MNKEDLLRLKKKLTQLSKQERKKRDLYLRKVANGEIQGPMTGYASIDKPWLKYYEEKCLNDAVANDNVYEYLRKVSQPRLDMTALNYFGNKIPYKELLENIEITSKSFASAGIKKGDVVSICMPSLPETMYCFFALSKIGAVSNMIDPRINVSQISKFINDSGSKMLITLDLVLPKINKLYNEVNLEKIISVSATDSLPLFKKIAKKTIDKFHKISKVDFNYVNWNKFIQVNKENVSYNVLTDAIEDDQEIEIVYTTGTTGNPKGAILTHQNILSMIKEQKYGLSQMKPGEKFLDIMPPFIAYGSIWGMIIPLMAGLELVIIPKFEIDQFDELLLKHKPAYIMGVPSFFEKLLKSKKLQKADLSFLKCPIVGGNSMTPSSEMRVNDFLKKHNCSVKIFKGYGMTEVSSSITFPVRNDANKIGSVGTTLSESMIKVVDRNSNDELLYGEKGELWLSGPLVIKGYLNNDVSQKETFIIDELGNRWVKSGDIGYIDSDGCVFITGRIKRSIIRPDGHNVYPQEIENIISMSDMVESCCVIGSQSLDYENGVIATAYIALKEEYKGRESEIEQCLRGLLSKYLQPRDVAEQYVFVDEIPLINGKIDYKKVEAQEEERIKSIQKRYLKMK